ncbi:MAG: hypothetical protein ACM32F_01765 [Betaproteobacteria bacterium]
MKTRIRTCRIALQSGAGIFLLAMAAAVVAATTAPSMQVAVHSHACVAGQRTFNDLDALVAAVRASGAPPVAVTACGSASIPAWLATVQRLSDFRLEPGVLDASAPACAIPAGPMRVSQGTGNSLSGIDPQAVERYWRQVQP